MATANKTQETKASVPQYFAAIADTERRADCKAVAKLMTAVTKAPPRMWGTAIVGFGKHQLVYASGRTLDWPLVAFSPRKSALTLYITGATKRHPDLLKQLGPHKVGGGCIYIKRLADVDQKVLKQLITLSVKELKKA